jgi:triacylglycerol esterase/lipase EstA (alpha/beta hydrolase family)
MPARSARLAALLATVALLFAALPASTSAAADGDPPLPVPYTFLPNAVLAGLAIDKDAPGTNDWSCIPSTAHPEPVVLTHGLMGNKGTNWQTYGPLLHNEGYCVFALTYGTTDKAPAQFRNVFGGLTKIESSAEELKAFVARVLASTGASKVDIVGHSEGTVMPNYYAKFLGGAAFIDDYVSIAPLWHGTNVGGFATLSTLGAPYGFTPAMFTVLEPFFASGQQLLRGSEFMTKMRSGGTPAVPGITYTNIVTKYDELVVPYTSGIEPGMTNIVVQKPCVLDLAEHFSIVADPIAARHVLNALDPDHAKPPRCQIVTPFIGGFTGGVPH